MELVPGDPSGLLLDSRMNDQSSLLLVLQHNTRVTGDKMSLSIVLPGPSQLIIDRAVINRFAPWVSKVR